VKSFSQKLNADCFKDIQIDRPIATVAVADVVGATHLSFPVGWSEYIDRVIPLFVPRRAPREKTSHRHFNLSEKLFDKRRFADSALTADHNMSFVHIFLL
jgi:hypothetical protein